MATHIITWRDGDGTDKRIKTLLGYLLDYAQSFTVAKKPEEADVIRQDIKRFMSENIRTKDRG